MHHLEAFSLIASADDISAYRYILFRFQASQVAANFSLYAAVLFIGTQKLPVSPPLPEDTFDDDSRR